MCRLDLTNGGIVVDQGNDVWTLHWAAPYVVLGRLRIVLMRCAN